MKKGVGSRGGELQSGRCPRLSLILRGRNDPKFGRGTVRIENQL